MRTLYVSDLDGTLLRSDERTSDFTNQTINALVEQGMLFSYATARSYQTAPRTTKGLKAAIPLIVYNGAMVVDNKTGTYLLKNFFGPDVLTLLRELLDAGVYPIVYAFVDGVERFSFWRERCAPETCAFLDTRRNDPRENPVDSREALLKGDIFYITCIGQREKLEPFFEAYRETYHCVFQVELYTKTQWLEIMPREATKANAARQLKALLNCDRVVAFGDGENDVDLFKMADECYAMENGAERLKEIATAVIGSNDEDSVAKWLLHHAAF